MYHDNRSDGCCLLLDQHQLSRRNVATLLQHATSYAPTYLIYTVRDLFLTYY